ncbi:MAG: AvaI/BsoBI family type II restriction endonuclease [Microcoleus sp.]
MCAYRNHLKSSDDIVTTYEATRAGFVALAL